jgi:hypothetical protein
VFQYWHCKLGWHPAIPLFPQFATQLKELVLVTHEIVGFESHRLFIELVEYIRKKLLEMEMAEMDENKKLLSRKKGVIAGKSLTFRWLKLAWMESIHTWPESRH